MTMKAQRIKDNRGNVVLLFATCAKQEHGKNDFPPFTVMRDEVRAALMHEKSAKYRAGDQLCPDFRSSYFTQLHARSSNPDHPGLDNDWARVPVLYAEGDKRYWYPPTLEVGCVTFTGTNAKAFYKWAMFRTPLKRSVKRGKKA